MAHFNLCDEVLPNHAPTLEGRVRALYYLNRFEEALADGRRVYALDPSNADNCNTIGAALRSLPEVKAGRIGLMALVAVVVVVVPLVSGPGTTLEAVPLSNMMRVPRGAPVLALGERRTRELDEQENRAENESGHE